MAKPFHSLAAATQERRVREVLAAGIRPEEGEVCIALEQPESELTAIAEVLERVTREEDTMTTRTERAETTKAISRARKSAEETGLLKPEAAPKPKPRRTRAAVTTKRVRPTEPDYDKLPEGKRADAKAKYEAALAKFEAQEAKTGLPVDKETGAKLAAAVKKAPADTKAKAATKKPGVPTRTLGKAPADTDGFDWKAKSLPGRVLKLKASGKTIKQITAELGLPAREGVWHRVSLVYRAAADAKGIERQRRSGTK